MLLFHDTVHILNDHNGIIHHDTYRQDQSQQSHHVEREAEYEHDTESTHKGNRHRYGRDKRGPPALERQENHQYHQEKRLEESLVHMVYGLGYVCGHIERDVICHPLRETLADLLHCGPYVVGDLHCIGPREKEDIHHSGIPAVDTALGIV